MDDFRKSMQNTYWLYQKAKQLKDDSSKVDSRIKPRRGGNNIFFTPPTSPLLVRDLENDDNKESFNNIVHHRAINRGQYGLISKKNAN